MVVFGAALVSKVPFSMVMTKGLGVNEAGVPSKSRVAPSLGISLAGIGPFIFRIISVRF